MRQIVCDKCKKPITTYNIIEISEYQKDVKKYELCNNCTQKIKNYLGKKESDKEEGFKIELFDTEEEDEL